MADDIDYDERAPETPLDADPREPDEESIRIDRAQHADERGVREDIRGQADAARPAATR